MSKLQLGDPTPAERLLGNPRLKGIALVIFGATLWGISGNVAQYLFQCKGFSPQGLVEIRMLLSGIILLLTGSLRKGNRPMKIWVGAKDRWSLMLFAVFGMLGVQYTYYSAIKYSNAATGTLLQYLGPAFITAYVVIRGRRLPSVLELTATILALTGTFLLVTNGSLSSLSISPYALFWGIGSALCLSFYTLYPIKLLNKWGSSVVAGWGMLVGGLFFSFIYPPWLIQGQLSYSSLIAILYVVLFGTVIAFLCYLESLKYVSPSITSLLACFEPLTSTILCVVWFNVQFNLLDWLGALFIVTTIVLLSYSIGRRPACAADPGGL